MSEATNVFSPLVQWWRRVSFGQRIATLLVGLACVVAIWSIAAISSRPSYATLYSGLQEKDLAEIVAKLQESKTPYQLNGEGTVQVPADKVHEVRLQMATAGLPKGGSVGYEIFDQNKLGGTEFEEKLNYRRALQGELERTIQQLAPVEQARVHLALPEKALFTEQQERPTASVVLKLRRGGTLSDNEVNAVVHLVASSVEGLPKDNVTVLDANGTLLSAAGGPGGAGGPEVGSQLKAQTQVEQRIARDLQSVLDRIVGPGRAVIRVSADLDFDQRQAQEETYKPQDQNTGVLESQRENRENYNGSGGPGRGASGVPATSTLAASALGNPPATARTGGAAAPGKSQGYERTETDFRYRVSKRTETITNAPGTVKKLSVAVFVDEAAQLPSLGGLEAALSAAAGVDQTRGDRLVVQRVPFGKSAEEAEGKPSLLAKLAGWYKGFGSTLVALALLGVFTVLAKGLLRPQSVTLPPTPVAETESAPAAESRLNLSSAEAAVPGGGPIQLPMPAAPGGSQQIIIDADRAAAVIRGWLSGEETR